MSMKQEAVNGMRWTSIATVTLASMQFLQIGILARLLEPSSFGLMGMIMVVVGFAQSFSDMGLSNAIIQRKGTTKEQLSSLYWLNILSGIIVFILVLIFTPFVVSFYNEPQLESLLFMISFVFLITPIGQQFQVLLEKDLKFDIIAKIDILSSVFGVILSIFLAFLGQDVKALVWGLIVTTSIKSVSFLVIGWKKSRPIFYFNIRELKGFLRFGFYQMGEKSLNYFSANSDYILIGRYLGAEVLGVYTLAYQLVVIPLSKINPMLTKVAFPIFSKVQNDNELIRRGYLEIAKLLSFIIFPLLIGLALTSEFIIPLFFGVGWEESIVLIQILAPLGMIKTLGNPNGSILLAKGHADIAFKWNLFVGITNFTVFFISVKFGLYALTWSYVFLVCFYFILMQKILSVIIDLDLKEYFKAIRIPFIISISMGAFVYISIKILSLFLSNLIFLLTISVLIGILVYMVLNILFNRAYLCGFLSRIGRVTN